MLRAIMEIRHGHLFEDAMDGIFLEEVPSAEEVETGFNRGTEASVTFIMVVEVAVVVQLPTPAQMTQIAGWDGRTTLNIGITRGMVRRLPSPLETPHITQQVGNRLVDLVG
jgi:hypothetical protein